MVPIEASRREVDLDLEIRAAPSELRDVRRALRRLPIPGEAFDTVELLVTELVSNSIRHAGLRPTDRIRVRTRAEGDVLRVEVFDGGPGGSVAGGIRPSPGAESGWGLWLVDRLATRWGHRRGCYWFEIGIGAGAPTARPSLSS
jgi:serine/threonine-protein kinase RsbW